MDTLSYNAVGRQVNRPGAVDGGGYTIRDTGKPGKKFEELNDTGEPEDDAKPIPAAPPVAKEDGIVICALCDGKVDMGFPHAECVCGLVFHKICANDEGECPSCGGQLA